MNHRKQSVLKSHALSVLVFLVIAAGGCGTTPPQKPTEQKDEHFFIYTGVHPTEGCDGCYTFEAKLAHSEHGDVIRALENKQGVDLLAAPEVTARIDGPKQVIDLDDLRSSFRIFHAGPQIIAEYEVIYREE